MVALPVASPLTHSTCSHGHLYLVGRLYELLSTICAYATELDTARHYYTRLICDSLQSRRSSLCVDAHVFATRLADGAEHGLGGMK